MIKLCFRISFINIKKLYKKFYNGKTFFWKILFALIKISTSCNWNSFKWNKETTLNSLLDFIKSCLFYRVIYYLFVLYLFKFQNIKSMIINLFKQGSVKGKQPIDERWWLYLQFFIVFFILLFCVFFCQLNYNFKRTFFCYFDRILLCVLKDFYI